MRAISKVLLNAESTATDLASVAIRVSELGAAVLSVFATATGSTSGTMTVQASNDISDGTNTFAPSNWYTVINSAGATSAATINSSTAYVYFSPLMTAQYVRLIYTRSSGSGVMTAKLSVIGVTH